MKTRFILPVLFLISFSPGSFTSCKEPSSGPETEVKDSLVLKFKESDLTSATLSLHTSGVTLPASVSLYRNGDSVQAFLLHRADTTLKDSLLSPSTSYNWQAKLRKTASSFLTSNTITARTMDTTSHTFTWKLDTLGAAGSVLFDVAIVNDTCVWVVGDIKSQPYSPVDRYNAAMWNGKVWKKFRIKLKMWNQVEDVFYEDPIRTLFLIDKTKLVVSSESGGFGIISLDGKLIETKLKDSGSARGTINKIWGTSSQNLFFVGTNGSITHYNGSSFTLMESGTTVNLQDVWGTSDHEVWACGWSQASSTVISVLLTLQNNRWKVLTESTVGSASGTPTEVQDWISSVFAIKNSAHYWVASDWGIFKKDINNKPGASLILYPLADFPIRPIGRITRIRGVSPANLIAIGEFGSCYHFNGNTWHRYMEITSQNNDYYGLDCKTNMVVAAGRDWTNNALILFGKR